MSARPSSSREPSLLTIDSLSRRSSMASNPDVFSDDYALEPIDSNLNLSLVDSIQSDHTLTYSNSNFAPYPAVSNRLSLHNRPSSTTKQPAPNDGSSSSIRGAAIERHLSTSTRFSIPRSQSPYTGPTVPSHPYAMYPQVTRASSIASQSTIRHTERPYVPSRGPEHPYTMYPQNPVDEDAEDIGTQAIPLGFPGVGYGSSRGTSNSEMGDIVGSDGHVEHLPPYTRYADNVVAKGDMAAIHGPLAAEIDMPSSERSQLMSNARPSSDQMEVAESDDTTSEQARKEGWRQKAHRRVCGGIALWLLVLIIGLVVLAATVGGVIGGVVGRQQGTSEAMESSAATTTVYMDADPASTDSSTPACPTGRYTIPVNQTQEVHSCVSQGAYTSAWACLDFAFLGMTVGRTGKGSSTVQFVDYSADPAALLYGPQPPDFNSSTIPLLPYKDKDDEELGVAMYYYQTFDKLVILPSSAFGSSRSKRSVSAHDVFKRSAAWDGTPLSIGDQPWFCFWNNTINEFWMYLDKPVNTTSTTSTSISTITSSSSSISSTNPVAPDIRPSWTADYGNSYISSLMASATFSSDWPSHTNTKRSYTSNSPYYPTYPRMIKMVEKRQPTNNIQPYCQMMQVNPDWSIVPLPNNDFIFVQELDYANHPVTAGGRKRDTTNELESNCICEWMST